MQPIRRRIMGLLPVGLANRLRYTKRAIGRARRRVRGRLDSTTIDQPMIEVTLRDVGLRNGDSVFFQASLSAFGWINGGPDAVIGALSNVVGPRGLIAMPVYPMPGRGIDYVRSGAVFDALGSPSYMGAISERFRTQPGVHRSLHPLYCIAAWGDGAQELVSGHEEADTQAASLAGLPA